MAWTSQERQIILDARKFAEYYDEPRYYEMRRGKFREMLRRIGRTHDYNKIRFAYAVGQNLVLDESDIMEIMGAVWGLDEDDIYSCVT